LVSRIGARGRSKVESADCCINVSLEAGRTAMIFKGRSLSDISLDDIRLLVENRVPEDPALDYKESPYGGRQQDRREMLRDITGMANSGGGYLIIGIREDYASRAATLTPFHEPHRRAQAINQTCLDGVRDRIEGMEVGVYETGFNQGIIVVRVPASHQRPHMVTLHKRTDFFRRYGTDKRPMTIGEIREMILSQPRFRQLVESELQAAEGEEAEGTVAGTVPPYAQVITQRPVERFLHQYLMGGLVARILVIVSPFIGDLAGTPFELRAVTQKAMADQTRLYVITREPRAPYHQAGVAVLEQCPVAEIRYNDEVHAKLYVAWSGEETESLALFGSGNLTETGLRHNIELGIMIFARGYGRSIVRDLYHWSAFTLRSMSKRVKAISMA